MLSGCSHHLMSAREAQRAPGRENWSQSLPKFSQEIHTLETLPLYLVWFALDTTDFPHHNPPCLLLRSREVQKFPRCDRWGKHDAIFAGVDGAVHQSGMFRAWALVAGTSVRPQRGLGILSQLRMFLAGGTAADRPAPSHEAAGTDCTAVAPQATIDFLVGVAPSYKGPEMVCLRSLFLSKE